MMFKFIRLLILSFLFLGVLSAQESDNKSLLKQAAKKRPDMTASIRPKIKGKNLEKLSEPWIGYVSDVGGIATINRHTKDGSTILITFQAEEGDLISETDSIETGKIGSLEITLKNNTQITIAPKTIVEIMRHYVSTDEQESIFNLLFGNMMINVSQEKEKSSVKVLAPNLAVHTDTKLATFATNYDPNRKTTRVACLGGEITAEGVTDNKDKKHYSQYLEENQYMTVTTSYEGDTEIYLNTDPAKMTTKYKNKLLDEFNTTPIELDPWSYEKRTSTLYRIAPGFEYGTIRELPNKRYYNFSFGFVPIMYLGSIFYLEPYFYIGLASTSTFFMRAGGSLELYPWRGFYLGSGAGLFCVTNGGGTGNLDFNINVGYSFSEKQTGVFEGFRFSYFMSQTSLYNERSVMFSLLLNFASVTDQN